MKFGLEINENGVKVILLPDKLRFSRLENLYSELFGNESFSIIHTGIGDVACCLLYIKADSSIQRPAAAIISNKYVMHGKFLILKSDFGQPHEYQMQGFDSSLLSCVASDIKKISFGLNVNRESVTLKQVIKQVGNLVNEVIKTDINE